MTALTATAQPHRVTRRCLAVLAGFVAIFAVSTATDLGLHAAGVFPPFGERMSDSLFLLALTYRGAFGMLGGYITACVAPDHRVQHALVLGLIGVAVSCAGAVAMWDCGPVWYSLGNIAIAVPCAWVGGKLAA